jgi:ankyrin repeat protein
MAGNTILELKHHILNARLKATKKLITTTQVDMEDAVDDDGNGPLHWCAQSLSEERREESPREMLHYLVSQNAPRNRQNVLGETPLLAALRAPPAGQEGMPVTERLVGEMLKEAGADPNRVDMTGETALMEAASAGYESIGKLLLEHRADPGQISSAGLTAADLAAEAGATDFADLLKTPLAQRALKEAKAKRTEEEAREKENVKDFNTSKKEQLLFGQRQAPGIAKDKDKPGKPYPEYGTLHDID